METHTRLLLADDRRAHRDRLSRRLAGAGYRVDLAEDGPQALERLGSARYDLLLLRGAIAGMNGAEGLRRLRQTWSPSRLPVILLTAPDESGEAPAALRAGANDWIGERLPFSVALARIEAQLRMVSLDRECRRASGRRRRAAEGSEDTARASGPAARTPQCSGAGEAPAPGKG